jgi:hypothetical protein
MEFLERIKFKIYFSKTSLEFKFKIAVENCPFFNWDWLVVRIVGLLIKVYDFEGVSFFINPLVLKNLPFCP